ncbi:sulfite reductase subunit alpha [Achromobacter aloeverae]
MEAVLVVHASQTGQAVELAEMTADVLRADGVDARVAALGGMDAGRLSAWPRVLFVASTYGEGDPPDEAATFAGRVMASLPDLRGMRYAVLALGDATYENFCGFGRRLAAWLRDSGATPLFDTVEVDRVDSHALRRWHAALAGLATGAPAPEGGYVSGEADGAPERGYIGGAPVEGAAAGTGIVTTITTETATAPAEAQARVPAAPADAFDFGHRAWRLADRVHANPGSTGAPCYHLALAPADGEDLPAWQAGDIAEILIGADEDMPSMDTAAAVAARRDYSIASLPADGVVQLLVRQRRGADGALGLSSGWLTAHAPLGATVRLRIRRHPAFHAPVDDVPMILVGNGTGIAGLRAHLKARAAAGRRRNWLLFGERHAASDRYYDAELAAWQSVGVLARMDRVYSRDGGARRYVQEALADAAAGVREWVAAGAAIYVCGSAGGMAAGVDAVLRQTLGDETVTALARAGRYRRDVY